MSNRKRLLRVIFLAGAIFSVVFAFRGFAQAPHCRLKHTTGPDGQTTLKCEGDCKKVFRKQGNQCVAVTTTCKLVTRVKFVSGEFQFAGPTECMCVIERQAEDPGCQYIARTETTGPGHTTLLSAKCDPPTCTGSPATYYKESTPACTVPIGEGVAADPRMTCQMVLDHGDNKVKCVCTVQ